VATEQDWWRAADSLWGSLGGIEQYRDIMLGLEFLRCASDACTRRRVQIRAEVLDWGVPPARVEEFLDDADEYTRAGVIWVPPGARWADLAARATDPRIGELLNDAMAAIMAANPPLASVLPKTFGQTEVDQDRLRGLIEWVGRERPRQPGSTAAQGTSAEIYERLLAEAADAEGAHGGEFYTPPCIAALLVELLEPFIGRVYDPCCGVGGLLAQAKRFAQTHGGRRDDIAIYGQESNQQTWRMARMNLAIHGISADLGSRWEDTFYADGHPDLRADFIFANPPFNESDWARRTDDPRWQYGVPPASNANFAWLQHVIARLGQRGAAGVVLAIGSMSSRVPSERKIRAALVESDLVAGIVALPPELFRNTRIPACLWLLSRDKGLQDERAMRDRHGEILFIDARALGSMADRAEHVLSGDDIARIADTYHAWRGTASARAAGLAYADVPGFCYSAELDEVSQHEHILVPGRYVGATEPIVGGLGQPSAVDDETENPADEWTVRARDLARAGQYAEVEDLLAKLGEMSPALAATLRLELGFTSLPDPDRRLIASIWQATAQGGNPTRTLSRNRGQVTPTASADSASGDAPAFHANGSASADEEQPTAPTPTAVRNLSAQHSGETLEQATVALLARMFAIAPDEWTRQLSRLRRQAAGTQFGRDIDIDLDCRATDSPAVRCHVECKNLDRRITLGDIAAKLMQQEHHHHDTPIDHWILISPHYDVHNELREMLDSWEKTRKYPFSVQVWSPENGIRELFALEPAVYEAIYGQKPTPAEAARSGDTFARVKRQLGPWLRIAPVWLSYLSDPGALCFVDECAGDLAALYDNYLPLRAADERESSLDGTLMDHVLSWTLEDNPSPLLLLGDFGEGKSVFTYCLARELCGQFRSLPEIGILPLRIPMRDYSHAGSARALLEGRLREIHATLADWRQLARQVRTLAILDGFDEMSADLSPAVITTNLRGIESCLTELSGSKVLVTSRQRVLDGTRDWNRTLNRLQQPTILRVATGPRQERLRYLEQFATDDRQTRVLANLRDLYDPIGLAAKPLFLQMIKDTLTELPDDELNEFVLYDTYVRESLQKKIMLLAAPGDQLTDEELIGNLMAILEDVAVQLHQLNLPYINLKDLQGLRTENIAELLWRMRDGAAPKESFSPAADEDATSRIGIRSLLKGVPAADDSRWPVDFFHRSMREFFVARAIVSCLNANQERARRILGASPLLPEVTHFAATMLKELAEKPRQVATGTLESFARSATLALNTGYLGGNAITLLHASRDGLPQVDWSGLRLDHAQLRGADLSGTRFIGSSLRFASLENANLQNADFTNADLEGVVLEETSQVLAVATTGAERIIAAYEDRSLREWLRQPVSGWQSRTISTLSHRVDQLQLTTHDRIVATGEGICSVLDKADTTDELRCQFQVSPRFRATILGARSMLLAEELQGGLTRITWLDVQTGQMLDQQDVDAAVIACAQADGNRYAYATVDTIHIRTLSDGAASDALRQSGERVLTEHGISCIALGARGESALLGVGHHDGTVTLTRIDAAGGDNEPSVLWRAELHEGPVTSIVLGPEDQVITGSTDRSLQVTPPEGPGVPKRPTQLLQLTLRCRGVHFDGVRTEREQEKLRQYSAASSRAAL
jgi:type I restriction-modification system DNA methylase subunit